MKAGEVMKTLRISRSTLHRYATDGLVGRTKIGGYFDYHAEDVFNLLNKGVKGRLIFIQGFQPINRKKTFRIRQKC